MHHQIIIITTTIIITSRITLLILFHLGNSMDNCNALEIIHTYDHFCLFFPFLSFSHVLPCVSFSIVMLPLTLMSRSPLHAFFPPTHPAYVDYCISLLYVILLFVFLSLAFFRFSFAVHITLFLSPSFFNAAICLI